MPSAISTIYGMAFLIKKTSCHCHPKIHICRIPIAHFRSSQCCRHRHCWCDLVISSSTCHCQSRTSPSLRLPSPFCTDCHSVFLNCSAVIGVTFNGNGLDLLKSSWRSGMTKLFGIHSFSLNRSAAFL